MLSYTLSSISNDLEDVNICFSASGYHSKLNLAVLKLNSRKVEKKFFLPAMHHVRDKTKSQRNAAINVIRHLEIANYCKLFTHRLFWFLLSLAMNTMKA
jgi:hypothetical protein